MLKNDCPYYYFCNHTCTNIFSIMESKYHSIYRKIPAGEGIPFTVTLVNFSEEQRGYAWPPLNAWDISPEDLELKLADIFGKNNFVIEKTVIPGHGKMMYNIVNVPASDGSDLDLDIKCTYFDPEDHESNENDPQFTRMILTITIRSV